MDRPYDAKEHFVWVVATMFDHPSVYMGGPSHHNRRQAERVYDALISNGWEVKSPLLEKVGNGGNKDG